MITIKINPACEHGPDVEQCPICRARLVERALELAEQFEAAEQFERAERVLELAERYDSAA